jgi:hypothetical protein
MARKKKERRLGPFFFFTDEECSGILNDLASLDYIN